MQKNADTLLKIECFNFWMLIKAVSRPEVELFISKVSKFDANLYKIKGDKLLV